MLKRPLSFLIAFLLLLLGMRLTDAHALKPDLRPAAAQSIPDTEGCAVEAKGAVVIEADSGRVLYAKNANGRLPMASTTKIMTALLTLEQSDLEKPFVVDSEAIRVEGSSMGLLEGDSVSLLALAYGMLLPSGNDAANAAAVRIAGSIEAFVRLMNERAAQLGLEDTHFATPSGLDGPAHYSSAYDMALLARAALRNPRFADICSQSRAVVSYGNPPYDRWMKNHNRLLRECEGVVGVKTGFTKKAGRCLVSAAMRDGVRLIAVTLGCPDDWRVHGSLYDRYFGLLAQQELRGRMPDVLVPVAGGTAPAAAAAYPGERSVPMMEGEELRVVVTAPQLLFAPVERGRVIGNARFYLNGQPVAELPLTAREPVEAVTEERPSLWERLLGGLINRGSTA